jgi:hypothetical protein
MIKWSLILSVISMIILAVVMVFKRDPSPRLLWWLMLGILGGVAVAFVVSIIVYL